MGQVKTDLYTTVGKYILLQIEIKDISNAETVIVPAPCVGEVKAWRITYDTQVSVADAEITGNVSAGTDFMTQAILAADAAGVIKAGFATANNAMDLTDNIQISTDGASTTASRCTIHLYILPDV